MMSPARVDAVAATIDTAMRTASRVDIDASLVAGVDAGGGRHRGVDGGRVDIDASRVDIYASLMAGGDGVDAGGGRHRGVDGCRVDINANTVDTAMRSPARVDGADTTIDGPHASTSSPPPPTSL
jgi:hypothetical protein